MATAAAMCKLHASEARRPEAGSRAVGVSRAERGNDGSPNRGETRATRLDAQHDSATGHASGPVTPYLQGSMGIRHMRRTTSHVSQTAVAADYWPSWRSRGDGLRGAPSQRCRDRLDDSNPIESCTILV